MLMKLSLTRGRTKWVDQQEARLLQREGEVICVLAIRNEDLAEFPSTCRMRDDQCSSCSVLPH
jgi:hypothetical protein